MDKKIVCLLGNGLNFLLAYIIENDLSKKEKNRFIKDKTKTTAFNIRELANLWEKFSCFNVIRQKYPQLQLNDEDMIELIYQISAIPFSTNGNSFIISQEIENFIINKLKEVNKLFNSHERALCYRDIRNMFYDFGFYFRQCIMENQVRKLAMYTTNFDGNLETLFAHDGKYFPDGFGPNTISDPNFLVLNNNKLRRVAISLVHLHGSYKFCRKGKETVKLKGIQENEFPVMVFNNPHLKEERILGDSVLSQYLQNLKEDLKTCDRLIIFGNSLKTEPHIKRIIKDNFNRINTELVICDLNPEQVKQQLEGFYSNEIYQFTTARLESEFNLSDLFNQLFSDDLAKCGRNINNFRIAA
jgi:NAD-dependent SIR2 family protein deacetylase